MYFYRENVKKWTSIQYVNTAIVREKYNIREKIKKLLSRS